MDGTRIDTLGIVADVLLPSHALLVVSPSMLRTSTCTSTTGVVILQVLHVLVVRRHLSGHASATDPGSPASFAGVLVLLVANYLPSRGQYAILTVLLTICLPGFVLASLDVHLPNLDNTCAKQ